MPDVIPGDSSTTSVISLGRTVYGTIDTSGDQDWYRIDLVAGQTYEFRLHGNGIGGVSDTIVALYDTNGTTLLASNDDAGSATWGGTNGLDSRLTFTATTTGTYFLAADGFGTSIGNYILTAVVAETTDTLPATGNDMVFTVDEIAWQLYDNGEANFGNPPAAFNVGADGSLTVNITALTTQGQFLARNALQMWTDITGIQFVETSGAAEMTFDDNAGGTTAYANTSITGNTITSSNVMITTGWLTQFGTSFNSYSFETYMHEIGHALGLGHGGNYNGSAIFGTDNFYLNDSLAYSIMSYMQAQNDEFSGSIVNTFVNASFRYMQTAAIADIIAIQYMYGDNSNTRTGNTTYGYNSNTGNAALDQAVSAGSSMFFTVYDDGGIDTLDFSGASVAQTIRLAAESFSNVLGGLMNVSIARGTVVENAIGGSAADTLIGNAVGNTLDGRGGADTMRGMGGNDIYIVDNAGDVVDESVAGSSGFDIVRSFVTANLSTNQFLGGIEAVTLQGTANINAIGNLLNNILTGNNGSNVINGLAGADNMRGLGGNDTYVFDNAGDIANESLAGSSGNDRILSSVTVNLSNTAQVLGAIERVELTGSGNINATGNLLANGIVGNSGNNFINGLGGSDNLTGGLGSDAFVFTTALGTGASGNVDTITDFAHGVDRIWLDDAIFSSLSLGTLSGANLRIAGTGPLDANDFLLYNSSNGGIYYDADASGAGAAMLFAIVTPGTTITAADFNVF